MLILTCQLLDAESEGGHREALKYSTVVALAEFVEDTYDRR